MFKDFKQLTLNQLNEFQKYNDAQSNDGSILIEQLRQSVNDYYSKQVNSKLIDDLAWSMFFEYNARNKTYENDSQFDFSFNDSFPYGYNDLRSLFNVTSSEIINTSPNDFYNAFVFPSKDEKSNNEISNSFVTKWITSFSNEFTSIETNIKNIINFCDLNSQSNGNINLWENRGNPTNSPEVIEIANEVFINRHLRDVIEVFSNGAYIPSYLRLFNF